MECNLLMRLPPKIALMMRKETGTEIKCLQLLGRRTRNASICFLTILEKSSEKNKSGLLA